MLPGTRFHRLVSLLLALGFAALMAWGVGAIVKRRELANLTASTLADAQLRQALMTSEVARFRLLPLALADDRDLLAALSGTMGAARTLNIKLEALAASTGAAAIYVVGPAGRTIAASNWRTPSSFVNRDYRFRRYYMDAIRTGAGEQFALGTVSRKPGLYLSRRTRDRGVVVVKLEFDRIERQWHAAGGITYVTDRAGIVLVTSEPAWRFAATEPLSPAEAAASRADSGGAALRTSPIRRLGSGRVVIPGMPGETIVARTLPDAAGWRVNLARPTGYAVDAMVRTAQIGAALATLALFGAIWAFRERAQRRAARTRELEIAVAERTAELRREIEDRIAAEARAAELRDSLRQANRLAALGQITASVAHETAQPVAAIRNYAASGEHLLDRGETEEVRSNLQAIGRLTERIGTVTAELRGFARKGSGEIGPVPLRDVIEGAGLILKERLSRVTLTLPDIPANLNVLAGRVRLEQVVVNLLQNATEALEGTADPQIELALAVEPETVRLTVRDNGVGIDPELASRLFTPFVTSRPAGLGLGLVIAQDIMIDLGGALRLIPSIHGACFEIELRRA